MLEVIQLLRQIEIASVADSSSWNFSGSSSAAFLVQHRAGTFDRDRTYAGLDPGKRFGVKSPVARPPQKAAIPTSSPALTTDHWPLATRLSSSHPHHTPRRVAWPNRDRQRIRRIFGFDRFSRPSVERTMELHLVLLRAAVSHYTHFDFQVENIRPAHPASAIGAAPRPNMSQLQRRLHVLGIEHSSTAGGFRRV